MENLKVIVSGSFKEKALLSNAIGELLEREGFNIGYSDNSIRTLVEEKYEDCVDELLSSDIEINIELENLRKINITADLEFFCKELDKNPNETITLKELKEQLGKILLN